MNAVQQSSFVIEIEQEVLGSLLTGGDFRRVSSILENKHFIEPLHGTLFGIMRSAFERYNSTTVPVIARLIPDDVAMAFRVKLEVNVNAYLAQMAAGAVYGGKMIEQSARKIVEQWARIALADEAGRLHAAASDPHASPLDLVAGAGQAFDDILAGIRRGPARKSRVLLSDAADNAFAAATEARERGAGLTGMTWGLTDLNRLTGGMQRRDLTLIGARPSMGKAQPLSAKVRSMGGWKRIGDMRVGDAVMSVGGGESFVTGIFPQGSKEIFRVSFSDGRTTRCCADHLWRVHFRAWDTPRVLRTSDIAAMLSRPRFRNRLWIDQVSGDDGADVPLPLDPWVVGALLGDGGLSGGSIRFSSACQETVDRMRGRIPAMCKMERAGDSAYDYAITMAERRSTRGGGAPNIVMDAIRSLGLFGHRSDTKFIPPAYLDGSRDQRLDLLRGLLDTDGWVERHGTVCFGSVSETLASQVAELARSLGAWCSVSPPRKKSFTHAGEIKTGLPFYVCVISHHDPRSLFLMSEKVLKAPERRSRRKLPTFASIEADGIEDAVCISVSHPSRLYVTDDYIVTHNTTFAVSCGISAAKSGHGVGLLSLEMDRDKIAARAVCDMAYDWGVRVPYVDLIRGNVSEADIEAIRSATKDIKRLPLWIDDQSGITIADVRVKIEAMTKAGEEAGFGLSILMIDHLGLIRASSRYSGNRNNEIAEMTGALKSLAREYDIAIVLLSQLNRSLEQRQDKRPQLSDLRDSGAIEQDADTIMFLHREAYYLERTKAVSAEAEADRVGNLIEHQNKLEVEVAKQRNGPIKRVEVFADMACAAVRNAAVQR